MDPIGKTEVLFYGVLGGILGSFFKNWIDDLRNWMYRRPRKREQVLLNLMKQEDGFAKFKVVLGKPPFFENRIQDIDHPEHNFKFEDYGEIARMIEVGLIEKTGSDDAFAHYRITGRGYEFVE